MQITVRLFARARDLAGTPQLQLELPEGTRVRDVRARLLTDVPALGPVLKSLLMALDGEYVTDESALRDGCELAAFPPVSGG